MPREGAQALTVRRAAAGGAVDGRFAFIVGASIAWSFGYWWSWAWIIATTVAQLAFFRWKRWI